MRKAETQRGKAETWGLFLESGATPIPKEVKESLGSLKKLGAQKKSPAPPKVGWRLINPPRFVW